MQETRIERARQSGYLTRVTLSAKDLCKALNMHHTGPDDVMMGVPHNCGYVELALRCALFNSSAFSLLSSHLTRSCVVLPGTNQ